ncbi:unnamed protein product, partial [Didymodactylos carnosus]
MAAKVEQAPLNRHQMTVKTRWYSTKTFRLCCMLSLTFSYFIVELVVGNITNSVALVADAFHMLSDVLSLLIALFAVRVSKRRSDINTYGWVRAEVVGANVNTVFLLALCLTIVLDSVKRYIAPESIVKVDLLLIVGSVGLGINIIGLFLFQGFHGHSHGGGGGGHSHGVDKKHGHSHDKPGHSHKKVDKKEAENHENHSHEHCHDHGDHAHNHGDHAHNHVDHAHNHVDHAHGHAHNHVDPAESKNNTSTPR